MRIQTLELKELVRLQFSRIKQISLDFADHHTHLLLGTNGSGKSTLLREIFPTAPVRSQFSKSGHKVLTIEHHGEQYKLVYTPKNGHEFYVGDKITNLNVGGTQDVQKDLISQHFGISSDIQDILSCSLSICSIIPSKRKQLLMGLNPTDVEIFLDQHKTAKRLVVSLSNNLDRLYQRQKQLVEQKLPEATYREMLITQKRLEDHEKTLLVWATRVDEELRKYPVESTDVTIPQLIDKLRWTYRQFPKVSDVIRSTQERRYFEIPAQLEMIRSRNANLDEQLRTTIDHLDSYLRQRDELTNSTIDFKTTIEDLVRRLSEYELPDGFRPVGESSLSEATLVIEKCNKLLLGLTYLSYDEVLTNSSLDDLHRSLLELENSIMQSTNEIGRLLKRRQELSDSMKSYTVDKECRSENCELLITYTRHQNNKKAELSNYDSKVSQLTTQLDQDKETLVTLNERLKVQRFILGTVNKVKDLLLAYPELSQGITDSDISKYIGTSPLIWIDKLKSNLTRSEQYYERELLRRELSNIEKLQDTNSTKRKLSAEILKREVDKYQAQLDDLRRQVDTSKDQELQLSWEYKELEEYRKLVETASELTTNYEELLNAKTVEASRIFLLRLSDSITGLRQSIRFELTSLNKTIRDQESLLTRLDQEVDSVITDLKPKYEKACHVEKALAELPIKYTKTFVNDLIDTTNYLLSRVFTYSIKLIPYSDTNDCDFILPVEVEGAGLIKDISQCSTGQQNLIDFAFNLALIIELKFNDYPVFVDEIDRALDVSHKHRLSEFLASLVDQGIVSQLFVVNHSRAMIDMLAADSSIIVLNGDNIVVPATFNRCTKIVYY